jgi:hypothetical protein
MRARCMVAIALATALVAVGGCGGGSSSKSTATTTDTSAQFKTRYAAVANQLRLTTIAIGKLIQQAPRQTDAQLGTAFSRLATTWQAKLSELKTLKPPANLAATFNTVTDAATRVVADLNAIVAAARTHSAAAARQASASLVGDIATAKDASTKITNALNQH